MTGTELSLRERRNQQLTERESNLVRFIGTMQAEIGRALPKHLTGDRMARLTLTLVRQSVNQARKTGAESLADCTPESFAGALLTSAALGLEPGINQEAYLVPHKDKAAGVVECTLIIGYQGYAKLFWQHPLAKHLDAHEVCENDEFDYAYGLHPYLVHKPIRGAGRGQITDYYACAELSTGASAFVVLTTDQVKQLRGNKVGPQGKIPDPMHWMERKTALRQLVKLLPKSANLIAALAVDEQRGSALTAHDVPAAITAGDPFPALPPSFYDDPMPDQRVTLDEVAQRAQTAAAEPSADTPVAPTAEDLAELNAEANNDWEGTR